MIRNTKFYPQLLTALTLCFGLSTHLFAQNVEWVNQYGASGSDIVSTVVSDIEGNVYAMGTFRNTVDFDPGPATTTLSALLNSSDLFVTKMNAEGDLLWVRRFGGTENESSGSLHVDGEGNIYCTGSTLSNSIDLDPGDDSDVYVTADASDCFVVKLNSDGEYLWGHGFGGSGQESFQHVTTDSDGNVWIAGQFEATVDFDPGAGTANLTAEAFRDGVILRLTSSGEFLSAQPLGGTSNDEVRSVFSDNNGHVYVSGRFSGAVDFDPGVGVVDLESVGTSDGFILKYTNDGTLLWAKPLQGDNIVWALSMTQDSAGNLYVNGRTTSSNVDYDPGPDTFTATGDRFLLKLDADGNFIWVRTLTASSSQVSSTSLSITSDDVLTMIGNFSGTIDFNPGDDTVAFTAVNQDGYIWQLDSNGDFVAVSTITGDEDVSLTTIQCVDPTIIYVGGYFDSNVDADPGSETLNLTSAGFDDGLLLKLNNCSPSFGSETISSCDSFTWSANNVTYSETGVYSATLANALGCDSLVTLDLTINSSSQGEESVVACESYLWPANGMTYDESGEYVALLSNALGCDSLVTLDLTIATSVSGETTVSSCGSFTWEDNGETYTESGTYTTLLESTLGCDSLVTLNLTVNTPTEGSEEVTACESYTWPATGETYSSSDTYTALLTNVAGCDSVATLNLTINPLPDVAVTIDAPTIQANNLNGSYTWLDCNNNFAVIPDEDDDSFTPEVSGSYAVEITENGCSSVSECIEVTIVSVAESNDQSLSVYPNPSSGTLTIDLGRLSTHTQIRLFDTSGRQVYSTSFARSRYFELSMNQPAGVYLLHIESDASHTIHRVVKQ
jgi:hypothetical protein